MQMGHFQDFEVHSTSRAKPVPWVAHTGELLVSRCISGSVLKFQGLYPRTC